MSDRRPQLLSFALLLLLVLAAACATLGGNGGLSREEIAALPPDIAESYQLFSHRCSRCHTLSRPLSAQVEDEAHWRLYVTRMRRQPGSGISEADGEKILRFLVYYSTEMRPSDEQRPAQ